MQAASRGELAVVRTEEQPAALGEELPGDPLVRGQDDEPGQRPDAQNEQVPVIRRAGAQGVRMSVQGVRSTAAPPVRRAGAQAGYGQRPPKAAVPVARSAHRRHLV
jgi:hypothetical protein